MDHNPYTPPQANTELTFQQEAAPRPISVWLLIFMLLAFVLAFVVAAARLAGAIISRWADIQSIGLVLVTLAWQLFLVAVFGAAAYALYHRRTWSKWFGWRYSCSWRTSASSRPTLRNTPVMPNAPAANSAASSSCQSS